MRRRGWTVAVGALLVALFTWQILRVPVPYVALSPGLTVNTLGNFQSKPVIAVAGRATSESRGQLRMVTVNVVDQLTLADALYYWFSSDHAVLPREFFYPPNKSREAVVKEQEQQFQQSQSTAETAALQALGFPVQVTVMEVDRGTPADGKLLPGDVITSVDGTQVTSAGRLSELIKAKDAPATRTIGYTRSGRPGTVALTPERRNGGPVIGVKLEQKQPHSFTIRISLEHIGGPSAGLIFALGIVDKLDPADLTGGTVIAGTGGVDDDGDVMPMGGIPQKMRAAKADGATVFLTPASNCEEAVRNSVSGLTLVKVSSLKGALDALAALRENRKAPACTP